MRRSCAVVAGGAGFVGSHLCRRLLHDGHEVVCIDNLLTGSADNIRGLSEVGPFRFVQQDVVEPFSLPGCLDAVFNLASPASPLDYLRHPLQTLAAGSAGTLNTLELAREKGARYVLASTSEVYGDPHVHPQPESYWGTLIRSVRAASITRPNGTRRRWCRRIAAATVPTPPSPVSSIPTDLG